jgi:hypothetical protein
MMSEDTFETASVAFVPVSDPMRVLDVYVWDARKSWHRAFGMKGRVIVAMHLGSVAKGYNHAWILSDEMGMRVASLPSEKIKTKFLGCTMRGFRFSGYRPVRDMAAVWRKALEEGSVLPAKRRTDAEVFVAITKLFHEVFEVPEGILESYYDIERFEREGPFRRIR